MLMAHLVKMGLFPKMKMRRNRVLKKMHDEISDQHKNQRLLAGQPDRLRYDVDKSHGQHVPGAQRQKILQDPSRPIPPHDKIPANQIPRRRNQSKTSRQPCPHCQVMSHMECGSPAAAFEVNPMAQKLALYGLFVPSAVSV